MPSAFDPRSDLGTAARSEAKWHVLDQKHGGRLQARALELLAMPHGLAPLDARIKTLAEQGWSDGKIAVELGIQEKTVYNHASKIRKLAGAPRNVPFRKVLISAPPRFRRLRRRRHRMRMI